MAEPPELRIDPLTGLRAIVTAPGASALQSGGPAAADPLGAGRGEPDLFAAGPATGAHELIASPGPLGLLDPDAFEELLRSWQDRMREHGDASYVHLVADATGAAELFALPFVPAAVARERERFTAYFDRTQGRNLMADVLQEEVRRGERVVAVGAQAVAICPFASRGPWHIQLIPRAARARFEDPGPTGAATLHDAVTRLRERLGDVPPLDLWIRTAPVGATTFCWHIDLLPHASRSGLETGTGVQVTPSAPEETAARLRDVAPS